MPFSFARHWRREARGALPAAVAVSADIGSDRGAFLHMLAITAVTTFLPFSSEKHAAGRLTTAFHALLAIAALLAAGMAQAEDGYDLWLRYRPLPDAQAALYRSHATQLVLPVATPTQQATRDELLRGLG